MNYYIKVVTYSKKSGFCLDEDNEINFVKTLNYDGFVLTEALSRAIAFVSFDMVKVTCDYLEAHFQTAESCQYRYEFKIVKLETL